jgi:hypothetical protein
MSVLQKILFGTIVGGVFFSGYMSAVKLFQDTCLWNTSCPYFLGYPACYIGFLVYLTLFLFMIFGMIRKQITEKVLLSVNIVACIGVLFSGKFAYPELHVLFQEGVSAFIRSVPLCAIGLMFFVAIFTLGVIAESRCQNGMCK